MDHMKLVITGFLLGGVIGLGVTPARAQGEISKDALSDGSYCHMQFPAIREDTLDASNPILKDSNDVIDFYGPCDTDPRGKEEIQAQKVEAQHRVVSDYNE